MKEDKEINVNSDKEGVEAFQEALREKEVFKEINTVFEEVTPDEPKKELTLEETKEAVAALRNVPYVKIKDSKGDVVNPITKEEPYKTMFANGKQRRDAIKRATKNPKNNKKGARVVVTNLGGGQFTKAHVRKQEVGCNIIPQYDESGNFTHFKNSAPRTIIHNDFKY